MSFFKKISKDDGFTIIELVVAFSLLAVATGIGFFSFLDFSQLQEVDQGAKNVASFIERGRANASSFVKPNECTGTLQGYRIDYCPNANCQGDDTYEMSVVCGGQEFVVDTLNLSEDVDHDEASNCSTIEYQLPQGVASGALPCTQILDRSGKREFVTVNGEGHVLFGEEGQVDAGNTPTPGDATPTKRGSVTPTTSESDPTPTSTPCASTETYLEWDKGESADITMCVNRYNGDVRYSRTGTCASTENIVVWENFNVGGKINSCVNRFSGDIRISRAGRCASTEDPFSWLSGPGKDVKVRACVNRYSGDLRILRLR